MSMQEKKGGNVFAIATMFALFFMIAFVTNIAGYMGPVVKSQFGASNSASQLGSAANFFAYLFMGIPGGLILKRKGYKFTSLLAVGIGILGLVVQLASGFVESFAVYVTGAFVAGFSMCLLNLVVNPLLNTLGGEGKKGNQLVQFGCSLNSVGATLAPYFVGMLVADIAKAKVAEVAPVLYTAIGIFVAAFIVIMFSMIPEPHKETEEEKAVRLSGGSSVFKDIIETLKFRHFTFGAICIFFYIIIECGIPNMATLYMTDAEEISVETVPVEVVKAENKAQEEKEELAKKAAEAKGEKYVAPVSKPGETFVVYKEVEESGMKVGRKITYKAKESYVGAAVAGILVGAYWLCMMFGRLIGGLIGGKVSSKVMLTFCALGGIALMLAAIYSPVKMISIFGKEFPLSMCFMVACGFCTSVMWGGIFNLAAEGLGKYVPTGSGIFMTMVCGGFCLPLQGWIADTVGILSSYWLTIALLAYVLVYAHILSKPTKRAEA